MKIIHGLIEAPRRHKNMPEFPPHFAAIFIFFYCYRPDYDMRNGNFGRILCFRSPIAHRTHCPIALFTPRARRFVSLSIGNWNLLFVVRHASVHFIIIWPRDAVCGRIKVRCFNRVHVACGQFSNGAMKWLGQANVGTVEM